MGESGGEASVLKNGETLHICNYLYRISGGRTRAFLLVRNVMHLQFSGVLVKETDKKKRWIGEHHLRA